jgi:hypothetical protein
MFRRYGERHSFTEVIGQSPGPKLAQAVAQASGSSMKSNNSAGAELIQLGEPLDIEEVAALIGCSVWTIRQRYIPRGLPYFRLTPTGKLIFYRDQVIRWVLSQQKGDVES